MKTLLPLLLLFVAGYAADPRSTNPESYSAEVNRTVLGATLNDGPQDDRERELFERIDALFKDSPGYRPYREDIGKRIVPPQLLHAELPVYPRWARKSKTQARVVLAIRLDGKGGLMETKVFSTTDERFNEAAIKAIKKWKFTGGLTEGVPDAFVLCIPMEFKM
jgi:TonB family protein